MKQHAFAREAAFARPEPPGELAVRLLRADGLGALDRARWAELSSSARNTNIFIRPWFMESALRHSGVAEEVRLAIVSRSDGVWLGVLPLVREARFGRWPVGAWRTWASTNQFLGGPLVRAGAADRFWQALLAHLDTRADGAMLIHCRQFADDDAAMALLGRCKQEGRGYRELDRFVRPARIPGLDGAYAAGADGKARARLRSLWRRIERDHGPVAIDMVGIEGDCAAWIDRFLTLEASGWKGRAGSALACDRATENLFRDVIHRAQDRGQVRLATLTAGTRVLAMSSWFVTGDCGFGFKMTFDESYRCYAPGQLLMHHIAEQVAGNPALHFDTCNGPSAPGSHPSWTGRRTICDYAVAIGPPPRRRMFDGLMRMRAALAAAARHRRAIAGYLSARPGT